MKELITFQQANTLMWAILVIAPVIGLIIGNRLKETKAGLGWGLAVGISNIAVWHVYNAITNRLGLDTVKNLLTNLGLFIGLGIIIGMVFGLASRRKVKHESAVN